MVRDEEMITTLEAAERLHADVMDVYRLIDKGQLTPAWKNERLMVPVAQVEALLSSPR